MELYGVGVRQCFNRFGIVHVVGRGIAVLDGVHFVHPCCQTGPVGDFRSDAALFPNYFEKTCYILQQTDPDSSYRRIIHTLVFKRHT